MVPTTLTRRRSATTVEALRCLVRRVAGQPGLWAPHVREDATEPHRVRLDVDGVEVWVITWPTFRSTALHSHPGVDAVFTTVRGVVHQVRPDGRGRLVPRAFGPGVVEVVPGGEVHEVRNERSAPAVTVHAYSGPLATVEHWTWDPVTRQLSSVGAEDAHTLTPR